MNKEEYKGNPSENPSEEEKLELERIEKECQEKDKQKGTFLARWYFFGISIFVYWLVKDNTEFLQKTFLGAHRIFFTDTVIPPIYNLILALAGFYLVLLFYTAYVLPFCSKTQRMGRDNWAKWTLLLGLVMGVHLGMSLGDERAGFLQMIMDAHTLNFKDMDFNYSGKFSAQISAITWLVIKDSFLMVYISILGIFSFLYFYYSKEDIKSSLLPAAIIAVFYTYTLGIWVGMVNALLLFILFFIFFVLSVLFIKFIALPIFIPVVGIINDNYNAYIKKVLVFFGNIFSKIVHYLLLCPLEFFFSIIYKLGRKAWSSRFIVFIRGKIILIFNLPLKFISFIANIAKKK